MRRIITALMLAGIAATPVLAQEGNGADGRERADRQQRPDVRARPGADRGPPRGDRADSGPAPVRSDGARIDNRRGDPRHVEEGVGRYGGRDDRGDGRRFGPDDRAERRNERDMTGRGGRFEDERRGPYGRDGGAGARRGGGLDRGMTGGRGWDRGWREDRRYDWQGARMRNRDAYHLPRYAAPGGYGYRRYAPGYRIAPSFYQRRYWIADPWSYRLPPVWGGQRWVRYYNDVLLIDIGTGRVLDVISAFFW